MEAMAVYLVPLMVGTRNIAFPRLNAFSYWIYLAGGLLLWIAFALDMGPDGAGLSCPGSRMVADDDNGGPAEGQ